MSEQLKQQGKNAFIEIDDYKVYIDVGATTLNQLQSLGIIPSHDLGTSGNRKPDRVILKKQGKKDNLFVIGENKDTKKFDTEQKQMDALKQAIEVAELFTAPRIPVVYCTDGSYYIYAVLKGKGKKQEYKMVKTEDGYIYSESLLFEHGNKETNEDSIGIIEQIIAKTDDDGRFVIDEEVNPSNLATRVWQKTWIAKKCKPEQALSLFIEMFILKYLSDLGIFGAHVTDSKGNEISFQEVYKRGKQHSLSYYFDTVRPYIKTLFPPNTESENFYPTTIINGLPLSQNDTDDSETFYGILVEFNSFGKLNNISKDFKTRLFEDFLKGTQIIADRGAYFTPRKVVQAIVDMADIPSYKGSQLTICDPACGVGGFIFEAMNKVKSKINLSQIHASTTKYVFQGFDINEDENHAITGVLGKANCLIYLSDKFASKPKLISGLSAFINQTLYSYKNTKLGSLSEIKKEEYDLILTNPPYVVSGSGDVKESLKKKGIGYKLHGAGIESIFVEKIVYELKQNGRAFIVLPDGIFNRGTDKKLRNFIYENCQVEAIIGLPLKTFFNTPKKTYVLVLRKIEKTQKEVLKVRKTFIYEAQSIGETLDANRFDDYQNNDLKRASTLFKSFVNLMNSIDYEQSEVIIESEIANWQKLNSVDLINEKDLATRDTWIFKKEKEEEKEEDKTDQMIAKLQSINSDIYQLISLLRS